MFILRMDNWSLDSGLQIIHADVYLEAEGAVIIDEPLCADVGMPALLRSVLADTVPDRWAPPERWEAMPFFVCGCGDPECRAYSFVVKHLPGNVIRLTEVEERQGQSYRELGEFEIGAAEYGRAVMAAARSFLAFTEGLDYRPQFAETVRIVRGLAEDVERKLAKSARESGKIMEKQMGK